MSKTMQFKEFVKLQRGFDLPNSNRKNGIVPVVASTGISGYHNEYKVNAPGVVTGRSGSLGTVQYITQNFWPLNTTLWVKDFKGNWPKYVYYYLQTMKLEQYNSGAGVPTLNRNDLDVVNVNIHNYCEQQKIANVLSAYDDLIENNNRRIAILEEMAQKLYREWFVHFRFPGHENCKMVESELGKIPEGWMVATPKDFAEYYIGGGWGKDYSEEKLEPAYVIRGTDIPRVRNNDVSECPLRYHTASNLNARILKNEDIIIEVSGGSKGQPVGRALLITQEILDNFKCDCMCASFCKMFRCNKNIISPYYFNMWLQEIYQNGEIEKYQSQSTGIINFKFEYFVDSAKLLVPPKDVQKRFYTFVKNIKKQIDTLGSKNTNLRKTRDLLLPALINGDIDVSELDIKVKEE